MSATNKSKDLEDYASYLEMKLEKLTRSAPQNDEQIHLLFQKIVAIEEKIANLTKVVSLVQTYTEAQELDFLNSDQAIHASGGTSVLLKRIADLERKINGRYPATEMGVETEISKRLNDLETRQRHMEQGIKKLVDGPEEKANSFQHFTTSLKKLQQSNNTMQLKMNELQEKLIYHEKSQSISDMKGMKEVVRSMVSRTDDLCIKIMEQLMRRIRHVEKSLDKEPMKRRIEELLAKQRSEFALLKKSLISAVEGAAYSTKLGIKSHCSEKAHRRHKGLLSEFNDSKGSRKTQSKNLSISHTDESKQFRSIERKHKKITPRFTQKENCNNIMRENTRDYKSRDDDKEQLQMRLEKIYTDLLNDNMAN